MTSMQLRDAARWRALKEDESGSALVLALLVVLLVGAMMAGVLQYQGTGFSLAPRMQVDRNEANFLQGAVEGAVNSIRGSSDAGRTGRSCPSFTPPSVTGLKGVDGKTFRVDCSPLASPLGSATDSVPGYAVHTLGTAAGEGINITGNNPLFVNGPVYSNGIIAVDNQPQNLLRVNGSVNSVKACTGNIITTDPLGAHCNPAAFAAGDPGYPAAIGDQGALDSLIAGGSDNEFADPRPACSSGRVNFSPGYYGIRPDVLAGRFPACTGKVWAFAAGNYYFDYAGDWLIKGYQVVGGDVAAGHTVSTPLGAACDVTKAGVRFVFGGGGTISTQSSSGGTVSGIELCGPLGTTPPSQRIVLYGLSAANTATTTETAVPANVVSAAGGPGPSPANGWINPGGARTINATGVATTVGAASAFTEDKSAALSYGMPADAVAKGAKVTAVRLRVAHTLVNAAARVTISAPGLPAVDVDFNQASCPAASPCTSDVLPLVAAGTDVDWRILRSLSLTYTATADKDKNKNKVDPHTAVVDGVDLVVTFTSPTYRRQTCGSGCTFFDSGSNPNVYMHGTVDMPAAAWSVNVHNTGTSIFDRGVVVRTIDIKVSGSSKQTESPFQLPSGTPGGRYVYFRAYVGTEEKLRACVLYTDEGPLGAGTTAYYGYDVAVRHWLLMRTPTAQSSSC